MDFCPHDGSLLQVTVAARDDVGQQLRFFCPACDFVLYPKRKRITLIPTKKKEMDDIIGGAHAWDNVDRTTMQCPSCNHMEAYFMQIQIRSADEPMTTFFKCVNCAHRWTD
ncbi:hypothetical protein M885DRAFT_493112 [Pelagophyceae sp. CCMP2097]|nr:hypothetical protein M885DRAFT_493112 [Pelagophyceae sp. CCMP2097]